MEAKSKNVNFPLVLKTKERKCIKKRYVLKATDGKTATRIKILKRKTRFTTTHPVCGHITFQQPETNFDKNHAGAAGRAGGHAPGVPTIIFI